METTLTMTSEIKDGSLRLMKNCWAEAFFITLINAGIFWIIYLTVIFTGRLMGLHTTAGIIPFFTNCTPSFAAVMLIILTLFWHMTAPVYYGTKWFFWQASGGNVMPVSSIFAGYSSPKQFLHCIKLRNATVMRKLPMILSFGAAAVCEVLLARALMANSRTENAKIFIGVCFIITGAAVLAVFIITSIKYLPIGYLLADNPDARISEIMDMCSEIFKEKNAEILKLYTSMWKWLIACIAVFPVLVFIPYFNMTSAFLIRQLMNEKAAEKDKKEPLPSGGA